MAQLVGVAVAPAGVVAVAVAPAGVVGVDVATGGAGVGVYAGRGVWSGGALVVSLTLSTDGPSNTSLFQLLPSVAKVKRIFMVADRHLVRSRHTDCHGCTGLACPNTVPLCGQVVPPSVDTC